MCRQIILGHKRLKNTLRNEMYIEKLLGRIFLIISYRDYIKRKMLFLTGLIQLKIKSKNLKGYTKSYKEIPFGREATERSPV